MFNNKDAEEKEKIEAILRSSIEVEENQMRTYLIAAERIHNYI